MIRKAIPTPANDHTNTLARNNAHSVAGLIFPKNAKPRNTKALSESEKKGSVNTHS